MAEETTLAEIAIRIVIMMAVASKMTLSKDSAISIAINIKILPCAPRLILLMRFKEDANR